MRIKLLLLNQILLRFSMVFVWIKSGKFEFAGTKWNYRNSLATA